MIEMLCKPFTCKTALDLIVVSNIHQLAKNMVKSHLDICLRQTQDLNLVISPKTDDGQIYLNFVTAL